ncbi:MAG TPA: carboxypeptidase regulatory-like domain-containing protein, partial [Bryobacteraceae bacterium]
MIRRLFLLLSALCLLACAGWAQSFRGAITGTIQDSSGSLVAQAKVFATETTTNVQRETVSSSTGGYLFGDLPPGTYKIRVSLSGFKEVTSGDIILTAQAVQHFDVTLQVGSLTESVVVSATAPTINTENGDVSGIVSRGEMLSLPTNSRSTFNFLYLNSYNIGAIGSGNSIGGLRSEDTNFTLDGVTSNNNVYGGQSGNQFEMSLEGVREVKLMASNNSAEFSGVATVIVTSRSGENQFHGSGFFLTDNYALNASNFFTHDKPEGTIDRQYGGSIGGPVLLPKLYRGRDKTFFYFNWERVTSPTGYNVLGSVPAEALRNGNFSGLAAVIKDPTTGQPFPGNVIPDNRISPVAKAMEAALIPKPTIPGALSKNVKAFNPNTADDNRYQVRLDHVISEKDTVSGRFSFRPTNAQHNLSSAFVDQYYNRNRSTYNIYLSETHAFTPNMLNEFRIGYSRDHQAYTPQQADGSALLKQFGITDIGPSTFPGMPTLRLSGFSAFRNQVFSFSTSEAYELLDNFTLVKGRHAFKMGVSERYNRPNQSFDPIDPTWSGASDYGIFRFNGFATGNSVADFLLGIPNQTVLSTRAPNSYERWVNSGAYFQDDFRISPKLTVNLGVRWEFQQPPTSTRDFRATIDLHNGYIVVPTADKAQYFSPYFPPVAGVESAEQAGLPARSLMFSRYKDFAPRISFAWQALAKTVVRGGYGIYYTPLISTRTAYFEGGPFQSSQVYYNSISHGVPLFQFPSTHAAAAGAANGPSIVNAVDSHLRTPYVQQWNLTLERELPSNIVVRAAYRGFQSVRLPQTTDYNAPEASADPANQN